MASQMKRKRSQIDGARDPTKKSRAQSAIHKGIDGPAPGQFQEDDSKDSDLAADASEDTDAADHDSAAPEDIETGGWTGVEGEEQLSTHVTAKPDQKGLTVPPSGHEVRQMKDAASLFRSGAFKLQIDELLLTVRPKQSRVPPLQKFLLDLHSFLTSLDSVPPIHPLQAEKYLSSSDVRSILSKGKRKSGQPGTSNRPVYIPYPAPHPPQDTKWTVAYEPLSSSNIVLVGSWANGLSVKGITECGESSSAEGARYGVDLAVEMPDSLFQEKDYLDNRFFHKRAFFLARIATAISASSLGVTCHYAVPNQDLRRTVLVLRPMNDGTPTDFSKLHAEIRIIPTLSSTSPIPVHRLAPSHSNLRLKVAGADSHSPEEQQPTPLYNNIILLSFSPKQHLLSAHALVQSAPAYKDGLALIRVWANQRGYAGVSPSITPASDNRLCVRGFESRGSWWSTLLELAINGEEPTGSSGRKSRLGRLGTGLSSYQLFRAALDILSKHDFSQDAVTVKSRGAPMLTAHDYVDHHKAILVDSSSLVNVLAGVPLGSLDLLKYEALSTLARIDQAAPEDDPFSDVFLKDYRNLQTRFDVIIRVELSSVVMRSPSAHAVMESGSSGNALLNAIESVLRQGLGNRANAIAMLQPSTLALRDIHQMDALAPPSFVLVGLLLDPENAFRLVDHGPSISSDGASQDLVRFRELWGPKAELRRFKDGRIAESVVWDIRTTEERAHIPTLIVRHLLQFHFDIDVAGSSRWQADFDRLLRMPADLGAIHQTSAVPGGFKPAIVAFDQLVKTLKGMDDQLPLGVTTVSPISEYLRYTSPFAPTPLSAAIQLELPPCAQFSPVMQLVVQFENSGRWPDDLRAIQKIKLAFFEGLARALTNALPTARVSTVVGDGSHDIQDQSQLEVVTPEGWAFSLRIWHDREMALLDKSLENRSYIAKRSTGANESGNSQEKREKREAAAAKEIYIRRYLHAPRHHRAVAALSHRFVVYAGTVRLVKRWFACHWLAHGHVAAETIELLCASVFLRGNGAAGDVPSTKERGFSKVMELLAEWKWENGLSVPLYESDDGLAQTTLPTTQLAGLWKITTEFDSTGFVWTSSGPKRAAASRVRALAVATCDLLRNIGHNSLEPITLFKHPTEDYDFIIELEPSVLPRYHQNIVADRKVWQPQSRGANPRISRRDQNPELQPGSDPVQLFVEDLQRIYADTCMVFWDPLGGDRIGGVWDPSLRSIRPFRVLSSFSSAPIQDDVENKNRKEKKKDLVALNEDTVLAEIERLGDGLIRRIVVQVSANQREGE